MPGGDSPALCLVILHLLNLFTASKQHRQTAGQAGKKKKREEEEKQKKRKKDTNIHTLQTVLCLPFGLSGIKETLSSLRFVSGKEVVRALFQGHAPV